MQIPGGMTTKAMLVFLPPVLEGFTSTTPFSKPKAKTFLLPGSVKISKDPVEHTTKEEARFRSSLGKTYASLQEPSEGPVIPEPNLFVAGYFLEDGIPKPKRHLLRDLRGFIGP